MEKKNDRKILHIDMDAFFASVEIRDNPSLKDVPLIIGALPEERGVVSTCNYIARSFGVRSAMNIKEAYRLCKEGIYMRPNMQKYKEASRQIHKIWLNYTDEIEYISLDEGYLDVTTSHHLFGGASNIAMEIKKLTEEKLNLTCSIGVGYCMMAAKIASEEKKPNGYFEILTANSLMNLIQDRSVFVIPGLGNKKVNLLAQRGLSKVKHLYENEALCKKILGDEIVNLAKGIDERDVTLNKPSKSIGKEVTLSENIKNIEEMASILKLLSKEVSDELLFKEIFAKTITLKVRYKDMKLVTRSKTISPTNLNFDIFKVVANLLDSLNPKEVRLLGVSASNFENQVVLEDESVKNIKNTLVNLKKKHGRNIVKTAGELKAEKSTIK